MLPSSDLCTTARTGTDASTRLISIRAVPPLGAVTASLMVPRPSLGAADATEGVAVASAATSTAILPKYLASVFGLDQKTAIRYAASARKLLETAAEQHGVARTADDQLNQ